MDSPIVHCYVTGFVMLNEVDYSAGCDISGLNQTGFFIDRFNRGNSKTTYMANYYTAFASTYYSSSNKTWLQQGEHVSVVQHNSKIEGIVLDLPIKDYHGTENSFFVGSGRLMYHNKGNGRFKL